MLLGLLIMSVVLLNGCLSLLGTRIIIGGLILFGALQPDGFIYLLAALFYGVCLASYDALHATG